VPPTLITEKFHRPKHPMPRNPPSRLLNEKPKPRNGGRIRVPAVLGWACSQPHPRFGIASPPGQATTEGSTVMMVQLMYRSFSVHQQPE
jgi:hypothetical protein